MDDLSRQLIAYSMAHWPAPDVPDGWKPTPDDYPEILKKIIKDLTKGKKKHKTFTRIAGQSGSGKSTQLLPAVEAQFAHKNIDPILCAARLFVPYHPYARQIEDEFGSDNLRENTHHFTSCMLGIVVRELIHQGYPIILDVSFFDPMFEHALVSWLQAEGYDSSIQIVAMPKEISDRHITKRSRASTQVEQKRNVDPHTSEIFFKSTLAALAFYSTKHPDTHITIWSAWEPAPIYDGRVGDPKALKIYQKYLSITELPPHPDEDALRQSKISYLTSQPPR